MKIHVGTSGYGYKEWKGKFYPGTISPKEMLHFYSERLGAVEINHTFYRMPTVSILRSWTQQVPADFLFALKAPMVITHRKRLKNADGEMDYLFRTLSVLEEKLGPVLFQLPRNLRVTLPELKAFFTLIPDRISCAFEFRGPSPPDGELADLLRERRYSLCIADDDEIRAGGIASMAPWGYLRLRRSDYTDADLRQWLESIRSQHWERAFVFFKHEEMAKGPETALRFLDLISS